MDGDGPVLTPREGVAPDEELSRPTVVEHETVFLTGHQAGQVRHRDRRVPLDDSLPGRLFEGDLNRIGDDGTVFLVDRAAVERHVNSLRAEGDHGLDRLKDCHSANVEQRH